MKKLLSKLRRGDLDYNLIQEGDKIAVGLSGGKDSVTLLYILKAYQRFSNNKFELIGITIDGNMDMDFTQLKELCVKLEVPYYIFPSNIKKIVFEDRKEKNPCSLCANLRRGILNNQSKILGCNKVALGHHKNDAVESLMLSMFYEGRIGTFAPKTYLSRKDITVIRPMIYIEEEEILEFLKDTPLPVIKSKCPVDGKTQRESVKIILNNLEKEIPGVRKRLFSCIKKGSDSSLWNMD